MTPPISKIIPPPGGGIYQGAFLGDGKKIDAASISAFEQKSGTDLDIALKFMAFSGGLDFPAAEAEAVAQKGGTLFVKLEPFNPTRWNNLSDEKKKELVRTGAAEQFNEYSLTKLLSGAFDDQLIKFAAGAKRFGKPVMVSFAHEMNGDWYPWSGNPELYKKAWKYIHDKISKEYGATNINWVWNFDKVSPAGDYYPGSDQVDIVAVDGYNWDGASSAATIFSGSLRYMKTLNKPMMIGEFAVDGNQTERQTDFVDFVSDPANKLMGFVYFDNNKQEGGKLREFGLTTQAEQAAYHDAIQRHRVLFESPIQTGETTVTGPTATAPKAKAKLPTGFDKAPLSPDDLIGRNQGKIDASNGRISKAQGRIAKHNKVGQGYKTGKLSGAIAGEKIVQWMLYRENGLPKDELLAAASGAPARFRVKAAFLVVTGNPNEKQFGYLQAMGYGTGKKLPLSRQDRFDLIKEIYAAYFANKVKDPILKAEMEFQLGLIAPDEKTADKYLTLAEKSTEVNEADLAKTIKGRVSEEALEDDPDERSAQLKQDVGQMRALKAQLKLQRAGKKDKLVEVDDKGKRVGAYDMVKDAYNILKDAAPFLDGIHLVQVKKLAAECLVRLAFTAKDLAGAQDDQGKPVLDLSNDPLLKEVQAWEKDNGGQSDRAYETFFAAAKVLTLGGEGGKSVLDWIAEFPQAQQRTDKNAKWQTPVWIKQISAYNRIWLSKLKRVELEEARTGDTVADLKAQRQGLEAVKKYFDGITGLDEDSLADVRLALLQTLAAQGFIDLNLAEPATAKTIFTEVKTALIEELKKDDKLKHLSQQTKAEINLALANIYYVEAGNAETIEEKKDLLVIAAAQVKEALAAGILRGPLLSYAHQAYGEILLLQKVIDKPGEITDAKREIQLALDIFPQNYGARAVQIDIISLQGRHEEAIKAYDELLKIKDQVRLHPTIVGRLQLGRAEAKMRAGESYSEESIKELETLSLLPGLFAQEAPGSYLVTRALNALLEAYGTGEDMHENIILICNILLGREYKYDTGNTKLAALAKTFTPLRKTIDDKYPRLRATLYLKLAEALIWQKRFDEADELLDKPDSVPAKGDLDKLIEGDAGLLKGWRYLIKAELAMKRDRAAAPVLDPDLDKFVFEVDDPDPDLNTRLVRDRIEGLNYEKKFPEIIALIGSVQKSRLTALQKLFTDTGRELGALKFKFELQFKLADAYRYFAGLLAQDDGGNDADDKSVQQFMLARLELAVIDLQTTTELKAGHYKDLRNLYQATVQVARGDIARSKWGLQNYREAEEKYLNAAKALPDPDKAKISKSARLSLARAYFGLGETYRYGKNPKGYEGAEIKDYDQSLAAYQKALAIIETLPANSDDRLGLEARIYIGLAKLEQQEGHQVAAEEFFKKAAELAGQTLDDDLQAEVVRTSAFVQPKYLTAREELFTDGSQTENRFKVDLRLPLENLIDAYGIPTPQISLRVDSAFAGGASLSIVSAYAGAQWRILDLAQGRAEDWSLNAEAMFKVPGDDLVREYSDAQLAMKYFRQPASMFSASLGNKYFSVLGAVDFSSQTLDLDDPLNTYFLNLKIFPPDLDFQFGATYNYYSFPFAGGSRARHDAFLTTEFNKDVADWGWTNYYDMVKVRASLGWPYLQVEPATEEGASAQMLGLPVTNFKAGVGTEIHLGEGFILGLDANFVHQADYNFGTFGVSLGR